MNARVLKIRIDDRPPLGRLFRQRLEEIPSANQQAWIMRLLIAGLLEENTRRPIESPAPADTTVADVKAVNTPKAQPRTAFSQLAGVIG